MQKMILTIDSISDEVNNLFNKFRTHLRRNYPEAI